MTLLHVNADCCLWRMRDRDGPDLSAWLDRLAPDRPVPILIHGFRYAPSVPGRDPHETILSRAESLPGGDLPWPRTHARPAAGPALASRSAWKCSAGFWTARAE